MIGTIVVIIDASIGEVYCIPMRNIPWLKMMPSVAAMMIHLISARSIFSRLMKREANQKETVPKMMRKSMREYGFTLSVSRISFVTVKLVPNIMATASIVMLPITF